MNPILRKSHTKKLHKNPHRLKLFFFNLFIFIILPLAALYVLYWYYKYDLPDLTKITGYKPYLTTEVYSSDGRLIGEFSKQKRKLIPYEEIPSHVKNAFLAIEDKRFFQHKGVDFTRIIAALIQNIKEGEIVQGASTITQQVTKNLILSPEKSISRKVKEAILAYRMENNLSKEEIFYIYLNHIYLAGGNYGVEAASLNYFGKSAKDINLAEAAMLAGLPKRPEYYSPRKHYDRAIERQRLVLKIMEEEGFINEKQKKLAEKHKINIVPKKNLQLDVAPYFVELVRQHIEDLVGTQSFLEGGFKIFTTIDIDLSLAAQWAMRRGIIDLEARRGRRQIIDHLRNEGEIEKYLESRSNGIIEEGKAYKAVILKQNKDKSSGIYTAIVGIGSRSGQFEYAISSPLGTPATGLDFPISEKFAPLTGYHGIDLSPVELKVGDIINVKVLSLSEDSFKVSLDFSPETQGALIAIDNKGDVKALVGGYNFQDSQFNRASQALRQPGSAFKPFIYAAAIDKGYTETSLLYDVPVSVNNWAPSNYDGEYLGVIPLRKALAKSRNLASVRLILDIGPSYAANFAKKFGFVSHLNPYPSLALGGSDVTLMEMVKAYNVFATEGKIIEPKFMLRIYDRNGEVLEDNTLGHRVSEEERLKEDREERRVEILESIARKLGTNFNIKADKEYVKEAPIRDGSLTEDNIAFLSPDEFLKNLQSNSIKFTGLKDGKQIINSDAAFIMIDLLSAVISEGTGRSAINLVNLAPIAGKTGTTNDFTDAWFMGFSPKITAGVWVGRDNHKSLGKGESGSKAALPIWISFMQEALTKYPHGEFQVPNGIRYVNTPYGNIPYTSEKLIHETIANIEEDKKVVIESSGRGLSNSELSEEEVDIDFLIRN